MNILPEISDKHAITYNYFPTDWQAVIWRNWGYIPVERIAKALETSEEKIREAAGQLGLCMNGPVNEMWNKRGFLTTIRENWHLCTYEQILALLNISEEELAFILREDDFMWTKLGESKPCVEEPKYKPLTEDELHQTEEIAELFRERFIADCGEKDNAFAFVKEYQQPLTEYECERKVGDGTDNLKLVYPYFALYGDALIDDSIDPFPDRILMQYAEAGINGIWMQFVLYQLVEFPFDSTISTGWEKRIQSLKKLVSRAKKYGISIYPYLNEPRAMSDAFFEKYPHLRGEKEGDFYAMCTSEIEVQNYLYQSVRKLFEMVPDLGGIFTITMSENLTNCYSRQVGEITCPRCKNRKPWEVVAEVNNLMAKGAHDAKPDAKVIVWTWGWPDEWAEKVIPLLTERQILQCTSEESMEFCIDGIDGRVQDYTMSLCGPGEKAKRMWKVARECGVQTSAKVQLNNTWEMAIVPFVPVFKNIEKHIGQLKEQGVEHLQMSWTLGGCPSPNLRLAAWLLEEKGTMREFLVDWLGAEIGDGVYHAQEKLSNAFCCYPFHLYTLYFGPQNFGPMAPFFLKETDYRASMVGFPYDDLERWRGIYPEDVYRKQYRLLVEGWKDGLKQLLAYEGYDKQLDEMILMTQAILCQYESAYHHIQFVMCRNSNDDREELLHIVHAEMETVQELIKLRRRDSRIGYESSNQYFYTLQDLKEKMINLAYCEKEIKKKNGGKL